MLKDWLKNIAVLLKGLWSHRRTIRYLLNRRGLRAVYNFLCVKFFVIAGGEGTGNWLGGLINPLFRLFPQLKPYLMPYPFTIEIEVTNKCNKKCIICEHTYWSESNLDLSFEDFKSIIDQFPGLKWINLTGEGDIFLNKDYLRMIRYLKARDVVVFFSDSFDLLDEGVSWELIKLGVDGIWMSIDAASKDTYEKIKAGCSFERSIGNIRTLIELKKKMKSPIPEVSFRYAVTTLNVQEMPQFVEWVHSLGGRDMLGPGSHIEFAGLLSFKEIEDYYLPRIPQEIIQATLDTAKNLDVRVSFAHPAQSSELSDMKHCAAWAEPYIMMGGYVMPCCAVMMSNRRDFLRKYALGNLLQRPFKEIWYSQRYRQFRKTICQQKGRVPILCRGCRAFNTLKREREYGVRNEV